VTVAREGVCGVAHLAEEQFGPGDAVPSPASGWRLTRKANPTPQAKARAVGQETRRVVACQDGNPSGG
jgi:hypothetical protein